MRGLFVNRAVFPFLPQPTQASQSRARAVDRTPRCKSENEARVSPPSSASAPAAVPGTRCRLLGSGRGRPAGPSSASSRGPRGRAESSQHYSQPRVSVGSGPWREPPGLAASAPSEPCGPRARIERQAPLPTPPEPARAPPARPSRGSLTVAKRGLC